MSCLLALAVLLQSFDSLALAQDDPTYTMRYSVGGTS